MSRTTKKSEEGVLRRGDSRKNLERTEDPYCFIFFWDNFYLSLHILYLIVIIFSRLDELRAKKETESGCWHGGLDECI